MVEQLICNQQAGGSSPFASSNYDMLRLKMLKSIFILGEVAEWSKAADCKSAGVSLRRFESCPPHSFKFGFSGFLQSFNLIIRLVEFFNALIAGVAQLARASAFQAEGRGFESRLPLKGCNAHVAQPVEHILGKDEVSGSSPLVGSLYYKKLELLNA